MKEQNLKLQIRILLEQNIAFGPGKADLLEAIERTGSISQAAKSMNMSYRRAWQLVDTMNQCFETALVETQTGGNTWWWGSRYSFGPESLTALPPNGNQCSTSLRT